jgi:hypothetical protein
MGNQDELYKKLSSLKDLKHAIKTVKKTLTAAEPAPAKEIKKSAEPKVETPQPESEHKLKYIGRKKLSNGVLSRVYRSPSFHLKAKLSINTKFNIKISKMLSGQLFTIA